ncbi:hypothetical protein OU682_19490, partial [Paracoccus sp. EF6]|nr:hypothetical protein [Paracoccus sp. EF6]
VGVPHGPIQRAEGNGGKAGSAGEPESRDLMVAARRWPVVSSLGIVQILAWGSSYSLMTVLAAGCALLAAGLVICATAPGLPAFYLGWCTIGFGMSAGLHDLALATLSRLYKEQARSATTAQTLWGRFASTVSWPGSRWLPAQGDWRGTVATYAVLRLLVSLLLILCLVPKEPRTRSKSVVKHWRAWLQCSPPDARFAKEAGYQLGAGSVQVTAPNPFAIRRVRI